MPKAQDVAADSVTERQIILRPVSNLLMDTQNPRLALNANAIQDTILKRMYVDEALKELASSFARNGYFWEEPLVAVPSGKELASSSSSTEIAVLRHRPP